MSVVIYTRVSTGGQVDSGLSLADQESRCRAYCLAHGLAVYAVLVEEGVSGSKPLGERVEGRSLLGILRKRNATGIVALKLDRLFRDVVDCLTTVEDFSKRNIAIHLVDFGGNSINTKSAIGKMFLTMAAGFAEFERNLTSERTKAALGRKKEKGERVGHIPFGKMLDGNGKLVCCKKEDSIILFVRYLRSLGVSVVDIIERLNRADKLNRGKKWTKSSLYRLIKREGIQ